MALSITFHGVRPLDLPGRLVDALGPQVLDAATVAGNYTFPSDGLYRVVATADHTVRFGEASLASAANGEVWKANDKEVRYMHAGDKVYIA